MSGTLSLTFNVSGAPFAVTLPIVEDPADPITFTIDWGDLTPPDSSLSHTYATDGLFTAEVTITAGSVTRFGAENWVGVNILTAVDTTDPATWGLPGVTSFSDAFNGAALLTSVPIDVPSSVTNMNAMFQGAGTFNADISGWNVGNVTNMTSMFRFCSAFNADISGWNVSNVIGMAFMLQGTSVFNRNIGGWNVGNVTDMTSMLESTNQFNQDISLWDVSKVVNMSYMFYAAAAFNQDLSSWAFTLVENMESMFALTAAFNQNISSWVLPAVNNMSSMFSSTTAFNNGAAPGATGAPLTWTTQTSNVTTMANMFQYAVAFNQDVSSWDVSEVLDMPGMFSFNSVFNNGGVALDWADTSKVQNMNLMFGGASVFNADITGWDVSSVANMGDMFFNATAFNQDLSGWDVSSVTNMEATFGNSGFNNGAAPGASGAPLTWNTILVNTMNRVFEGATAFNQDISSWNVSSVGNMSNMFNGATAFNQDISGWAFTLVANMSNMFKNATAFNQNINSWVLPAVNNMLSMFEGAAAFNNGGAPGTSTNPLTWINQTSGVTSIIYMFKNAVAFNQDISSWNVSSVPDLTGMFEGATAFNNGGVALTWSAGTGTSFVTATTDMFNGATAFDQDISSWNVSGVLFLSRMFQGATAFNQPIGSLNVGTTTIFMNDMFLGATAFDQDISSWNVSGVTNMSGMFNGATSFDQPINLWVVNVSADFTNMFLGATAMAATYGSDPGYADTPLASFFTEPPTPTTLSLTFNVTAAPFIVTLPIVENAPITFTIDWGDLTTDSLLTHTYTTNASFTAVVTITAGSVTRFGADALWAGVEILTEVDTSNPATWGLPGVTSFAGAFRGASLLTSVPAEVPSSVTDMSNMFQFATIFNQDISLWDVSNVVNMALMFSTTNAFNQDISSWNVSNVTDMNNMFEAAAAFNNGGAALTWDANTISVINMRRMFYNASAFNQDISGWDVSGVNNMSNMFFGATAFDQDISSWDVSSVTNMSSMFENAAIFDQNIRVWVVGSGDDLNNMFSGATAMAATYGSVAGYGNTPVYTFFNQDPPATLTLTFNVTAAPTNVILPIVENAPITFTIDWGDGNTDSSLSHTYATNASFNAVITITAGSVTSFGGPTWTGAEVLTAVATSNPATWGLPGITSFLRAFSGASLLTSVPAQVPSSVTSMNRMFNNASIFNQDISLWDVSNVTDMTNMFSNASAFDQNISSWNVSGVNSITGMFSGASAFNQNISSWNVSGVNNMSAMFGNASAFDQNISSWNVSGVNNMAGMFFGATAFNQNISTWNVSSVTNMTGMFQNASAFDQNIRVWVVGSGTDLSDMFTGATAMTARYGSVPDYGNTPLYTFFTGPPTPYPCFLEGTQILCLENDQEVYRPIESLRKGDLVKTIYKGYLPIYMIGTTAMYNPGNDYRVTNRLYKCPRAKYPTLFEDLYITGCHSILVPSMTDDQWENTKAVNGKIHITDNHFRLIACADEKAEPFNKEGFMNIYHIALENENYYMNYGIYANGLLVESCSKRYLRELSNMRILGEDDCSLTEGVSAEEKIFHQMPGLIETC
jgi:surface protein